MKEKKIWILVTTVLSFEVSKGHLKWKVAELARATGINRTLIYYYLGKTKRAIFDSCIELVSAEFYGLSPERMQLVKEGRLMECVHKSRKMFQDHPEFMIFYSKWRMKKSPVQSQLIEIEKRYQQKLKSIFTSASDQQIKAFHALLQGAVTSPFISHEVFLSSLKMICLPLQKEEAG